MFQQRDRLDEEIDELWNLIQRCKRNCNNEVQLVIWMTTENFEDLKDCFAETNQYGMLEENAFVEAEVPYVFQTNNMCLIAGFTVGTEGQLLNIVQQFEEDEDEGKIMDMWNVHILHIYLLTLLQVFCKWIVGMVNDEA